MLPHLGETTILLVPEREIDPECCNHHLELEGNSLAAAFAFVKARRSPT
jgi:hypothetical protein